MDGIDPMPRRGYVRPAIVVGVLYLSLALSGIGLAYGLVSDEPFEPNLSLAGVLISIALAPLFVALGRWLWSYMYRWTCWQGYLTGQRDMVAGRIIDLDMRRGVPSVVRRWWWPTKPPYTAYRVGYIAGSLDRWNGEAEISAQDRQKIWALNSRVEELRRVTAGASGQDR